MKKIVKCLFVALFVMMLVPAFAFNGGNLSKAMDSAAVAGQYLNEIMHPGMPKPWTNPMYMTMMDRLSAAWNTIDSEIGTIETEKDIENCRKIVDLYKGLQGTYRDLGYQVEISLDKRIKFLQVHAG